MSPKQFDVIQLLQRCQLTEAPTGDAATAWHRVMDGMTRLMQQLRPGVGESEHSLYQRLFMLTACLQGLLLYTGRRVSS